MKYVLIDSGGHQTLFYVLECAKVFQLVNGGVIHELLKE